MLSLFMFYRRYFMSFITNRKSTKVFTFVLTLALLISQFIFLPNYAEGAEVELLITGTGLREEVVITSEDWDDYDMVERTYSANNSLNFHKIIKTKGYDLFELIGEDNLKTDQDYEMLFICSDGFQFTKTVEELNVTDSKEELKSRLQEIANTGMAGSALSGMRESIEALKSSDQALADELLPLLDQLESASGESKVKSLARQMADKL